MNYHIFESHMNTTVSTPLGLINIQIISPFTGRLYDRTKTHVFDCVTNVMLGTSNGPEVFCIFMAEDGIYYGFVVNTSLIRIMAELHLVEGVARGKYIVCHNNAMLISVVSVDKFYSSDIRYYTEAVKPGTLLYDDNNYMLFIGIIDGDYCYMATNDDETYTSPLNRSICSHRLEFKNFIDAVEFNDKRHLFSNEYEIHNGIGLKLTNARYSDTYTLELAVRIYGNNQSFPYLVRNPDIQSYRYRDMVDTRELSKMLDIVSGKHTYHQEGITVYINTDSPFNWR